eukprot:TRINITY_DN483_c0_g1_i3.p1 TRINITY_DN483_c0_g1~~TRINITY_DN483_c0_g1_i3.p1  ORF type:complete len:1013 (+),score=101.91 TRINITY_DN483_c0_g1_i3:245-3283(+)
MSSHGDCFAAGLALSANSDVYVYCLTPFMGNVTMVGTIANTSPTFGQGVVLSEKYVVITSRGSTTATLFVYSRSDYSLITSVGTPSTAVTFGEDLAASASMDVLFVGAIETIYPYIFDGTALVPLPQFVIDLPGADSAFGTRVLVASDRCVVSMDGNTPKVYMFCQQAANGTGPWSQTAMVSTVGPNLIGISGWNSFVAVVSATACQILTVTGTTLTVVQNIQVGGPNVAFDAASGCLAITTSIAYSSCSSCTITPHIFCPVPGLSSWTEVASPQLLTVSSASWLADRQTAFLANVLFGGSQDMQLYTWGTSCCSAGASGVGGLCTPCPPGSIAPVAGSVACQPCGTGWISVGGTTCDICLPGTYSVSNNCTACPAGSIAPVSGSSTCQACATGWISVGGTACEVCLPGTFAANNRCAGCAAGSFSSHAAATACDLCTDGWFSLPNAVNCSHCDSGYYAPNKTAAICLPCPGGSSTNSSQPSSSCFKCPGGTFSRNGTVCKECGIGTWSTGGSSACMSCPAGTYSNVTGATSPAQCTACPAGTWSSGTGLTTSKCEVCPQGTFSQLLASGSPTNCLPCPSGSYSNASAATSCIPCPETALCAIGSVWPLDDVQMPVTGAIVPDRVDFVSLVNAQMQSGALLIRVVAFSVAFGALGLLGVCVLCARSTRCIRNNLAYLDILFNIRHYITAGQPLMKRPTMLGGLCTLVFIVVGIAVASALILQFTFYNGAGSDSLRATTGPEVINGAQRATTCGFNLTLFGYNGNCSKDFVAFSASGSSLATETYFVSASKEMCFVRWSCTDCSFDDGTVLQATFAGELAYVTFANWTFECAEGRFDEANTIVGSLTANSEAAVLMGNATAPNVVALYVYPTIYSYYGDDPTFSYRLATGPVSSLVSVDAAAFPYTSRGFSFALSIRVFEGYSVVAINQATSWVQMLAQIAALLPGIMTVLVVIMTTIEYCRSKRPRHALDESSALLSDATSLGGDTASDKRFAQLQAKLDAVTQELAEMRKR